MTPHDAIWRGPQHALGPVGARERRAGVGVVLEPREPVAVADVGEEEREVLARHVHVVVADGEAQELDAQEVGVGRSRGAWRSAAPRAAAGAPRAAEGLGERVEVAPQHLLAQRDADAHAVVGHPVLGEVVGPHLLGAVARPELRRRAADSSASARPAAARRAGARSTRMARS